MIWETSQPCWWFCNPCQCCVIVIYCDPKLLLDLLFLWTFLCLFWGLWKCFSWMGGEAHVTAGRSSSVVSWSFWVSFRSQHSIPNLLPGLLVFRQICECVIRSCILTEGVLVPNITSNIYWPFIFSEKFLFKSLVLFPSLGYFYVTMFGLWELEILILYSCSVHGVPSFKMSSLPAKTGLEFLVLLPPPPQCWQRCRYLAPYLA